MLPTFKGLLSGPNSSIPVTSGPGPCVNCKFQPQARDPTTGQYYLFCSNACAAPGTLTGWPTGSNFVGGPSQSAGTNGSVNANSASALSLCNHCKKRPRYTDGTIVHPYCGRTCANLAKGKRRANLNAPVPISPIKTTNPSIATNPFATTNSPIATNPFKATTPGINTNLPGTAGSTNTRNGFTSTKKNVPAPAIPQNNVASINSTNTQNNTSSINQTTSSGPTCQTPGCSSPAYVGRNGVAGKYCTKTHRQWGDRGCISCRKAPMNGVIVFCKSCQNRVLPTAPTIVEVPGDHERYKSVASQFQQKWMHSTQCPEVRAIYKIVGTTASQAKYEQYLDQVETKGNFTSRGKPRGNERRRWHGTIRKCNVGDEGAAELCSDPSCSLCCIIKTSFDLSFFTKRSNWGMFGAGIYTSSTSSKSNGYSRNNCTSDWKAMLLNKVVVGKGYKMTAANSTLTEPPAGYDSVLAEVGAGLNYDELVVYNNDAIRPSYLVMYDMS